MLASNSNATGLSQSDAEYLQRLKFSHDNGANSQGQNRNELMHNNDNSR